MSGIRQGLAALLDGILALMVLMFVSTALMVSVLFSAIVTERRGELGLLKAIGARRGQVLGVMVTEAVLATGIGGILGVVLGVLVMRLFERSLVYYLENVGVPFLWVDLPRTIAFAVGAIVLASRHRRGGRALSGVAGEPARCLRPRAQRGLTCCRAGPCAKATSPSAARSWPSAASTSTSRPAATPPSSAARARASPR